MPIHGTESEIEQSTLDRLAALGYACVHPETLERPLHEVVLRDVLSASLTQR